MSQGGEKTEKPTPKRLRDARRKGQVAKSREIGSAANILAVFFFIWIFGEVYLRQLRELLFLGTEGYGEPFRQSLKLVISGAIVKLLTLTLPLLLLVIVVGAAANLFQVGVLFAFESVKPDLKKLNPASGLKKIFSVKNLVEFLKSVLKILFLSLMLYLVIKTSLPVLMGLPYGGPAAMLSVLASVLKKMVVYSSFAFIVAAAADYFFQKAQHVKELKMTKDEVKREYKEMEGDPLIKSKRRQLHQELLSDNMAQNVRKSTVVVTNPTRLAVALYYDKEEGGLPMVMAKGENLLAKRIVEIAQEEGIPVMMNVPLARDLYEQGETNRYIPSNLLEPVAEVLKWVYQLRERKE